MRIPPHRPNSRAVARNQLASVFVARAELCEDAEVFEGGRVALRLGVAPRDFLQEAAHDLSAARLRERVREADLIGARELSDLLVDVRGELVLEVLARRLALLERDEDDEGLAFEVVVLSDGSGFR